MYKLFLSLLFCVTFLIKASAQNTDRACAEQLIRQSIDAIGGEAAMKNLRSISYKSDGLRNLVEQSERPEGPAIPGIQQKETMIDFEHMRMSQRQAGSSVLSGSGSYSIMDDDFLAVRRGDIFMPVKQGNLSQDVLKTETIYVLFEALNSKTLYCGKDTTLQSQAQKSVVFLLNNYPVRIFFSAATHYITAVEVTKPYGDLFLDVWGDSKKITFFSFWYLLPAKVAYALQTDTYINGWHYQTTLIDNRNISTNVPVGDSLTIPDSTKQKIRLLPVGINDQLKQRFRNAKKEIAKDIWLIPGPCTSTILKQDNAVIVIESSTSSEYSRFILDIANELYPGLPVKTVITTSDAWFHMGGLREYAAINAKIWCLDLNKWIVDKLLSAPYITMPDAWARKENRKTVVETVSKKQMIGNGVNRLELYPFRTETGERMMMVYFPEHKIVYASDLFQPKGRNGKYWNSHYTLEAVRAIEREKLDVKQLYAMHSDLLLYADIKEEFK